MTPADLEKILKAIDDWCFDMDAVGSAPWWTREEAELNARLMKEAVREVLK